MRSRISGVMARILSGAIRNPAAWTMGSRRVVSSSTERARIALGIKPQGFGVKGLVRCRGGLLKFTTAFARVDAFEGKRVDQFPGGSCFRDCLSATSPAGIES